MNTYLNIIIVAGIFVVYGFMYIIFVIWGDINDNEENKIRRVLSYEEGEKWKFGLSKAQQALKDVETDMMTAQAISNVETRWEKVRKEDKIYIQKKEYYCCRYCGSKSETTEQNCTKCGAPAGN